MKYKVQTLSIDSFGEVDIPEGWIPLNIIEKLTPLSGKGTFEESYPFGETYVERELVVLEPINKIGK
jgi:hypothetical protein